MCPQLWTNDRNIMATDQKYKHISFRVSNDTWDLLTIDASIKNGIVKLTFQEYKKPKSITLFMQQTDLG